MERVLETGDSPGTEGLPEGAPELEWTVEAIAPYWHPAPGEQRVELVPGRLRLHPEGLVFAADDAVDRATGRPVLEFIPAAAIGTVGPMTPGTHHTYGRPAVGWVTRQLRRMRVPGFIVGTSEGAAWVFEGPQGQRRAKEVRRRFAA